MKKISYVTFDQKYLTAVVECWNAELRYDPISEKRFESLYLFNEDFDPALLQLALVDEKVVGFCLGIKRKVSYNTAGLEPHKGWILNIAVLQEYQKQGIGTTLLQLVEQELTNQGASTIIVGAYTPNYLVPGVDLRYEKGLGFFKKHQYITSNEAVSMQRSLFQFEMPEYSKNKIKELAAEGIVIKNYTKQYYSKLMNFLAKEFSPGWMRNFTIALQRCEAEETVIICLDKEDNILGYCMRKLDGNDARFGPIGVAEAERSKGLGGVLFDRQMLEMKKRGIYCAYFLWTSGPAVKFYQRHGMEVFRTFEVMAKEVV